MQVRKEDNLQTIEQLSAHQQSIAKACTVGLIIDATSAYFDESKHKYVKKIKLVDDSFNTTKYSPHQKYPYLTVFFYAPRVEDLPNPRYIGDLLYLRRFSFGRYNESFQGHYLEAVYCSWALIGGDSKSVHAEEYQTSRADMDLGDEKFQNLTARIRQLRGFARDYLGNTSILSIMPTGIVPKDTDLIVQVLKRTEDGFKLTNGREEFILSDITSFAIEGSVAKLRSVARILKEGKVSRIVPNNFTSLISLREWTHDSLIFHKNFTAMDIEDNSIYTSLAQLQALPLSECENKKYYVKVQAATASTHQFSQALKFYDKHKNVLSDTPKKDTTPVYKLNLVCFDESLTKGKGNQFADIWIFSYDGKGGDFVQRVNLGDLNEYSNYSEESRYFTRRIENVLNSESVKMTVEVLSDGKGGKLLRALHVA